MVGKHRLEDRRDEAVSLAWHIVAIEAKTRADKRLPDLRRLLHGSRPVQQTAQQQRSMMDTIAARYGLPLRRTRLILKPTEPVDGE